VTSAVVFAYHNVGVRCLSVLLAHGIDVALVVTHSDNPQEEIWFDSVAALARRHGIPVITPDDPNAPDIVEKIRALQPDFLFSFYYRLMLKPDLLAIPPRGAFNMHGSLLPKYRGRVPVNWAIIHGERETGATLHEMLVKPDAGRIAAQQAVPILPDDTAFHVFNKVTIAAEIALDGVLPKLIDGTAALHEQDLAAGGYFKGRCAEDGRIDWRLPAVNVHNLIRAVAPPYPGAFCDVAAGRLRVLASLAPGLPHGPYDGPQLFVRNAEIVAQCGDGHVLRLPKVEFAGQPLTADSFVSLLGGPAVSLT
jgi:methionyl-tRNA formyltransferase